MERTGAGRNVQRQKSRRTRFIQPNSGRSNRSSTHSRISAETDLSAAMASAWSTPFTYSVQIDSERTPMEFFTRKKRFKVVGGIEVAVFASRFSETFVNDATHTVLFGDGVGDDFVDLPDGQTEQRLLLFRLMSRMQIWSIGDALCVAQSFCMLD